MVYLELFPFIQQGNVPMCKLIDKNTWVINFTQVSYRENTLIFIP
ncbi:hypothetical protein Desgi_2992 [Desulfoscipio gibsoniae DSM 7213]|uniref:Uncharacterized protein n=1 Tax=Desulfoscipio gibsoniae DSM 7213 TaxID=767817 RepID=R4KLC8_9FIRM|nr:hypothetical protein Desgi_2992 [Desulfoscipio gibsoniae DSM 7213]